MVQKRFNPFATIKTINFDLPNLSTIIDIEKENKREVGISPVEYHEDYPNGYMGGFLLKN